MATARIAPLSSSKKAKIPRYKFSELQIITICSLLEKTFHFRHGDLRNLTTICTPSCKESISLCKERIWGLFCWPLRAENMAIFQNTQSARLINTQAERLINTQAARLIVCQKWHTTACRTNGGTVRVPVRHCLLRPWRRTNRAGQDREKTRLRSVARSAPLLQPWAASTCSCAMAATAPSPPRPRQQARLFRGSAPSTATALAASSTACNPGRVSAATLMARRC